MHRWFLAVLPAALLACGDEPGPVSPSSSKTRAAVIGASAAGDVVSSAASAGPGGKTIDHGTLTGLGDDDHTQYVPVSGVRSTTTGFALTGTFGSPSPLPNFSYNGPPSPALLWHAGKGAFRVGGVYDGAIPYAWDDVNIGQFSMGLGFNASAPGSHAVAIGSNTYATGGDAIAIGFGGRALANGSFSVNGVATAPGSMALDGRSSGAYSVAIGRGANTNDQANSIVLSALDPNQQWVEAKAAGQFVATGTSFWFGSTANVTATPFRFIETSTGAYLSSGGAWVSVSDSARKTAFADVDPEEVLRRVSALPLRSWSYKNEPAGVRHLGPTAQAFRAAFGLGDTDSAIAGIDADGVSLTAIQALEKRTAGIATLTTYVEQQEGRIRDLELTIEALRSELEQLRSQLASSNATRHR